MTLGTSILKRLARAWPCLIPVFAAACEDQFTQEWVARPDTVELFSLSRAELIGRPSAYDFIDGVPLPVETPGVTGRWDVVLVDQGNDLALMPASAFSGLDTRAGIATLGPGTLEAVKEAPRDTAQFKRTAVAIRVGTIYVVRSRRESCGFGSGVRYAKLEALSIDKARGTLRFRTIVNPYCNDRKLIPPD